MRRLLNVRTVKEVVKLQSTVLCAFIAGIRVRSAIEPGKLKKCNVNNTSNELMHKNITSQPLTY